MCVLRDTEVLADRVLNEALVAAFSPAAMTRLRLATVVGRARPTHAQFRSSGVWVGPAAGSSAAIASAGGQRLPISSRSMQWVVREPVGGAEQPMARGLFKKELLVQIGSRDTRMFVDGGRRPHTLQIGDELRFCESKEPLLSWTPSILAARS